jgi:hypothetical protein
MTTRNDVFENVKIGETFYWGGNTAVKLNDYEADVYVAGEDGDEVYLMYPDDAVTVG